MTKNALSILIVIFSVQLQQTKMSDRKSFILKHGNSVPGRQIPEGSQVTGTGCTLHKKFHLFKMPWRFMGKWRNSNNRRAVTDGPFCTQRCTIDPRFLKKKFHTRNLLSWTPGEPDGGRGNFLANGLASLYH